LNLLSKVAIPIIPKENNNDLINPMFPSEIISGKLKPIITISGYIK
jgi:hypothetical protein